MALIVIAKKVLLLVHCPDLEMMKPYFGLSIEGRRLREISAVCKYYFGFMTMVVVSRKEEQRFFFRSVSLCSNLAVSQLAH